MKSAQIRSFFLVRIFPIQTEYGEIQSISPYSVKMQKKFGSEKTSHLDTFQAVIYATYSIMSFEDFQSPLAKHISRDYFQLAFMSMGRCHQWRFSILT